MLVRYLICSALALLAVAAVSGCAPTTPEAMDPQPQPPPPTSTETQQPAEPPALVPAQNKAEWATVKSFSGKEGTTTPAFHISGSKWRIVWRVETQEPQYTVLDILIYRQESASLLAGRITYSPGMLGDVVDMDEGGYDYYFKVISANLNRWAIDVEEYGSESGYQPVQITEIHYKGMDYNHTIAASHSIVEWDEYVEIHNFSDSPQNLVGWTLKNVTKGAPTFIFPMFTPCYCNSLTVSECMEECYPPQPCTIEPRESIRVHTGDPQWTTGGYCFYYYPGNVWDNETPDTAVLYNAAGQEVSRRSYFIVPGESAPNYSTPL